MNQVLNLAGCIIKDKNGKILLLHRNTSKRTQWEVPGGKIDEGETAEQTAIREIEEELGVKVQTVKLLGKAEFVEDDYTLHYSWYLAEVTEGNVKVMEPEVFDQLGYHTEADLRADKLVISKGTQALLRTVDEIV